MRMAELSRESGVPVATIKFYLREGLLPPGERTSPNQARYSQAHVRRLRLIRAMLDVGGLSLAQVTRVLAAVDSDELGQHDIFGVAQETVTQPGLDPDDDSESANAARERVRKLIADHGWLVPLDSPVVGALAKVVATIAELKPVLLEQIDDRADLIGRIADLDVSLLDGKSLEQQVEIVVAGTVLGDALMSAMRRVAQIDRSARRFGYSGDKASKHM
ncbi:MAG: MerR family transcriptional regulator [Thermocrispum agreste]|uniref:MerR family transcriptional regulator n=1 Tax=Thermocrispum agreste TaxID=37925 RepID=A0ABD6FE64_9PSEU